MGGPSNLSLSSHRQDDEKYNTKKRQLRQYLPQLAHHLDVLSILCSSLKSWKITENHSNFYFAQIKISSVMFSNIISQHCEGIRITDFQNLCRIPWQSKAAMWNIHSFKQIVPTANGAWYQSSLSRIA